MSTPLEASIVRTIMRKLEKQPATWCVKFHGSSMTRAGVPDILGAQHGRMFALEVKRPGRPHPVSERQKYELQKIANAGGLAAVVESVEDVRNLGLIK